MYKQIFEEWICKLDQKFCTEGQKTALLLENCLAYLLISNLTNIQLIYLPPNTTSVLQPRDEGIIDDDDDDDQFFLWYVWPTKDV